MCPHGYHHNGFMATPIANIYGMKALGQERVLARELYIEVKYQHIF